MTVNWINYWYVIIFVSAIHITDTQRNLKVILSNMSWSVISTPNVNCFGAGLHYDPRSESIIMNSHIGHIQFYSLFFNKLLYNVSICNVSYS